LWHFFVEAIYKVVVDCISAVVRAVEFVFHKIKVFSEDLIKWLGFIFEWQDILRTHQVVKKILPCMRRVRSEGYHRRLGEQSSLVQEVLTLGYGALSATAGGLIAAGK